MPGDGDRRIRFGARSAPKQKTLDQPRAGYQGRSPWLVLTIVALLFLAAHLPFLASTLEDIDSVNFALGLRDFDVAAHRPHPPGYPIVIALGKLAASIVSEPRALAVWSALFGALAVFPLFSLFRALALSAGSPQAGTGDAPTTSATLQSAQAALLTITCPLYWFTASRPMSDMPGFAAAVASQALLAAAFVRQGRAGGPSGAPFDRDRAVESGRMIVIGALVAGVAVGVRSQCAWLTLPLLALVLVDRAGRDAAGALIGAGVALTAGVAAWALPLVIASGGPGAYVQALGAQAVEDLSGVEMLATDPTPRRLAFALLQTFVLPWSSPVVGAIVLGLAVTGAALLLLRSRRGVVLAIAAFAPYAIFHLILQETITTRYALPLIPAVAFLAVQGTSVVARRMAMPIVAGLGAVNLAIVTPVLAGYAAIGSPIARALEEIGDSTASRRVVGMHYVFKRAFDAEQPGSVVQAFPARPKHEWLELVNYWRRGGEEPVWFLADPRRTDLALVDRNSRQLLGAYQWPFSTDALLGGVRPNAVALTLIRPPGWFLEEGWSLTPETAGVAEQDGRGPARSPIVGFVRRRADAVTLMIGGRNLGPPTGPPASVRVTLDGKPLAEWTVASASPFFLRFVPLAGGALAGEHGYARLEVSASSASTGDPTPPVSIEQFDVQSAGRVMVGFDRGWQEPELNPATGRTWRWASERSDLRLVDGTRDLVLRIAGESPLRYFDRPPNVVIRAADSVLFRAQPASDFDFSVKVPRAALEGANGTITLETDRVFVPAERSGSLDRRHLGLRVYSVDVRPAF
jgi:hypothetical protein